VLRYGNPDRIMAQSESKIHLSSNSFENYCDSRAAVATIVLKSKEMNPIFKAVLKFSATEKTLDQL